MVNVGVRFIEPVMGRSSGAIAPRHNCEALLRYSDVAIGVAER